MQSMKTFWIGIGVLALLILGYALFIQPNMRTTDEAPTETGSNSAKIDIEEVCNSALAYMTFENGAAAEAWVEECKRGEHPEAIEQWKIQMGITDDRAI
jgi:hypothetical protein